MALKLISFIGNIRDINSHREDLPYVQTKGMSFFFAFPLYLLFGHCHGIQIDMKYLGSRGRAKKAVMCKYQLLEPNREVNWNLQFWALPYHISKLTRVLDAQVAVPLLIYQQHFHRCHCIRDSRYCWRRALPPLTHTHARLESGVYSRCGPDLQAPNTRVPWGECETHLHCEQVARERCPIESTGWLCGPTPTPSCWRQTPGCHRNLRKIF